MLRFAPVSAPSDWLLQLAMSFSLGWIAQRFSIATGFFLLATMYAGATWTASRARLLLMKRAA